MCAAALASETPTGARPGKVDTGFPSGRATTKIQRVDAEIRVSAKLRGEATVLDRLYQRGSGKVRLPRGAGFEAVAINTAGGLTGGDLFRLGAGAGPGTRMTATSQAAERVYRSTGAEARVENRLAVGAGARLDWLPQETILFDRARLSRRLDVEMAEDAVLLATESFVFGRAAMGETMARGFVSDQWRIRRGRQLVFADAVRIEGAVAETLDATACLGGARACATLLYVAPDAEDRLEALRAALAPFEAGASAWNGLATARIVAMNGQALRLALTGAIRVFRSALPSVWNS